MDYTNMLRGAGYASSLAEMMRVTDMTRAANALRQIEEAGRISSMLSQQTVLQFLRSDHLRLARDIGSLRLDRNAADYVSEQGADTVGKLWKDVDHVARELHARSYYQSILDQADGIGTILGKYVAEDFLREQTDLHRSLAVFEDMVSLRALAELKNSPFSYLDEDFLSRVRDYMPEDDEEDWELSVAPEEIRSQIAATDDFNLLPEETKGVLYYLLQALFHLMLVIYGNIVWEQLTELRDRLQPAQTKAEVRTIARHTYVAVDREALKNYRVTIKPLNLREQPGMQGEIITTLPIGTLVQIIDKSKRSWLLVEVEIEGELEQGWVSRAYTVVLR